MPTLTTSRIPAPRTALTKGANYERGRCGSPTVHAARKTLQGHLALCDGGKVTHWVSGRFDPAATDACPACVAATG